MNGIAARSSVAWLTGLGLLEKLRLLARLSSDVAIPTPGASALEAMLGAAAVDVVHAADLVLSDFNKESNLSAEEVALQLELCMKRNTNVHAAVRAIAQLALGVTSQCYANDTVLQLERAAVVVLTLASVDASRDIYTLCGTDEAELRTEVAGLLARILAATKLGVAWRGHDDDQWVEASASSEGGLDLVLPGQPLQRWSAPVKIAEPAAAIAAQISRWDVSPSDIYVAVVVA